MQYHTADTQDQSTMIGLYSPNESTLLMNTVVNKQELRNVMAKAYVRYKEHSLSQLIQRLIRPSKLPALFIKNIGYIILDVCKIILVQMYLQREQTKIDIEFMNWLFLPILYKITAILLWVSLSWILNKIIKRPNIDSLIQNEMNNIFDNMDSRVTKYLNGYSTNILLNDVPMIATRIYWMIEYLLSLTISYIGVLVVGYFFIGNVQYEGDDNSIQIEVSDIIEPRTKVIYLSDSLTIFASMIMLHFMAIYIIYKLVLKSTKTSINEFQDSAKHLFKSGSIDPLIQTNALQSTLKSLESVKKSTFHRNLYIRTNKAIIISAAFLMIVIFIKLLSHFRSKHNPFMPLFIILSQLPILVGILSIIQYLMPEIYGAAHHVKTIFTNEIGKTLPIATKLKIRKSIPTERAIKEIVFEDVVISYVEHEPLLTINSLTLTAGNPYILIGPNGYGKSTVLYMLMGRHPANVSGTISIIDDKDNVYDLSTISLRSLREHISLMTIGEKLPNKSLRELFQENNPTITDTDIKHILNTFGILNAFVKSNLQDPATIELAFSQVVNTSILSGGQNQRLIAALKLCNPKISVLLIDELLDSLGIIDFNNILYKLQKISMADDAIAPSFTITPKICVVVSHNWGNAQLTQDFRTLSLNYNGELVSGKQGVIC